ncbi:MAG: hypothetical protein HUK02_05595 [Bacteroidaceae bacterium]|nr:hypothetical protein [Bacteroidaceae bacterium]
MRLKKKIFYGFTATCVVVLGAVRHIWPEVMGQSAECEPSVECVQEEADEVAPPGPQTGALESSPSGLPAGVSYDKKPHRIVGVLGSYAQHFPDLQDVHIVAARRWGVSPIADRAEAERRKDELVYVGCSPYYSVDAAMSTSVPYLVPRAAELLQTIGHNFFDSLYVKGVPLHRIMLTSALRTEQDVKKLRLRNGNATEQSCHRFGTTVDITYVRFEPVCPPGDDRRTVRDDTLKYVLSEVLRDLRQAGRCYVKYERKQSCFHITTR